MAWRGVLCSLLSACSENQISEAWYLMALFMQHACLRAHEYTVQFTSLKCPNCFSVLHEIFICLDVISQVFLVVVFLDRSMHRHVAHVLELPVPLTGPTWWCLARCSAWGAAQPCHAQELSCCEAAFPPFILPLRIARGFILWACPHVCR